MSVMRRAAEFAHVPTPMPVPEVIDIIKEDIARGPGQEAPGMAIQAIREHVNVVTGVTRESAKRVGTAIMGAVGASLDFMMEGPNILPRKRRKQ